MVDSNVNPMHRVLPRRTWFHGSGRAVVIWSIITAFSLCGLLVVLALGVDLVTSRGQITIRGDQVSAVRETLGVGLLPELPAEAGDDAPVTFIDKGLLPAVIRAQAHGLWGPPLAGAYRRLPGLRNNISALSLLVLLVSLLGLALSVGYSRLRSTSGRVAMDAASVKRKAVHRQVLRLGLSDLTGETQRTDAQLFLETAEQIRARVYEWCQAVFREPLLLVLLTLLALSVDWRLTVQCTVPLAACWWLVHYERSRARSQRELGDARATSSMRTLAESLRKSRLVRGYSMEEFEQEKFESHLDQFVADIGTGNRREGVSLWVSRVLIILFGSLVLYMVAAKVLLPQDPLPVYAAVLLTLIFICVVAVVESLYRLQGVQREVAVAGDKLQRFVAQIPQVGQAVGAKFVEPVSKSITYESVLYRLDGSSLLSKFDLRIPAGKSTALVSVNPLEARAAAYLLPRFIEPQSGRVLFDSEDINWGTLESIRAETLYVGGADPCFTGSVLENITCGQPGYTLQEATEAAKLVHAHKFVVDLPLGYETLLGEHGEQLDPGQAFRLGLARAAVRKPAVLIIEEPVTPLDEGTKSLIDDAYSRLMQDRTVIILPSRLSTVRRCAQVVFIHDGRPEAVGSHQELLAKSELYRHWEYVTFNVFRKKAPGESGPAVS